MTRRGSCLRIAHRRKVSNGSLGLEVGMKVVVRTDASDVLGHGHVARCLSLASALTSLGASVSFVCRDHEGNLVSQLVRKGYTVDLLPCGAGGISTAVAPLGASWQVDSEETVAAIGSRCGKADWVVVDHYGIDEKWEQAVRCVARRILVIDDLADRRHVCDVLLDQNLVERMASRYEGIVSAGCQVLLGPRYAILQPEYAAMHVGATPREGRVRRLVVYFGGADQGHFTSRVIREFLKLRRSDVAVDVVVPSSSPQLPILIGLVEEVANVHIHSDMSSLAPLFQVADLAVGACGATTWERLCVGLPSLVVTIADNQVAIARALDRRGIVRWVGDHESLDDNMIAVALRRALDDDLDSSWSIRCLREVDGYGASRVCSAMLVTADTTLVARDCREDDEALLLEWATDADSRTNSFESKAISSETHRAWYRDLLKKPDCVRLYVINTENGIPVGQTRFTLHGTVWEISYSLAPELRGRGMGRALLLAGLDALREDLGNVSVVGKVRSSNDSSCRVFRRLGFTEVSVGDRREFQSVL